ncbi:hypothetical protein [Leptospira borgpetersenii]|uniref:Tail fiber protein n=2 Tax=Leptospira borgpetersenii TaxID=174 RepID=M3GA43_LEPBO|nr:hypothetical protein [Leptospira borgpetersenii]EKP11556.1 hypothetical protein LEP1GSC128_1009 [Leptospira borgpetersenii str. 200801926]EMF97771.1 hypothetical protein LEP1GSC123_0912 [Leptospira borgpetersenii str. 200701203]ENO62928.1 hypothetical protein LEP1GSC191_4199 [Leptospira borgpetersenii serovar Mini str. 201000851]
MSWIQVETGRYENGSGWILENDPTFSWIMYNEEMEDEFPDTFLVLADLFTNPGLSVITLDPVTGKLPTQYLPALAINDTFIVSSQATMLSLSAERGDIAVRTDLPGPGMFILAGDDPAFLPNWIPLTTTYPDWNNIQNKPAAFPTVNHDHDSRYYTKSESDTLSLQKRNISTPIPATEVATDSGHRFVSDIQMAIWDAPNWNNIQNKPVSFLPSSHDHDSRYYTKFEIDALLSQKRNLSTPIPATEVVTDSGHRFVTDAQMVIWDAPAGGNISIPLGGIVEDSLNQLPSSNFREPDGLPISRFTYDALWNLVRRVVTSIVPATDRVNVTAHNLAEGQLVKFNFTGGGIAALTNYYVRNPTTNDFQISTGSIGGVINLTSSQTGDMITNIEYGFGDGSSTFNVPDRKGIFLRGAGVHGSRAKTSGGNYDGGSVGFAGQDRQISHSHQQYAGDIAGGSYGSGGRYADSGGASAATILYTGSPVSDGTGNPRNSNEVAPAWTAVRYKLRVL